MRHAFLWYLFIRSSKLVDMRHQPYKSLLVNANNHDNNRYATSIFPQNVNKWMVLLFICLSSHRQKIYSNWDALDKIDWISRVCHQWENKTASHIQICINDYKFCLFLYHTELRFANRLFIFIYTILWWSKPGTVCIWLMIRIDYGRKGHFHSQHVFEFLIETIDYMVHDQWGGCKEGGG